MGGSCLKLTSASVPGPLAFLAHDTEASTAGLSCASPVVPSDEFISILSLLEVKGFLRR